MPFTYILEKINKNYGSKYLFGYHDALKIYGAPKLCTVMYETTISNPSSRIFHNKLRRPSIQESVYNWTESNDTRKKQS